MLPGRGSGPTDRRSIAAGDLAAGLGWLPAGDHRGQRRPASRQRPGPPGGHHRGARVRAPGAPGGAARGLGEGVRFGPPGG